MDSILHFFPYHPGSQGNTCVIYECASTVTQFEHICCIYVHIKAKSQLTHRKMGNLCLPIGLSIIIKFQVLYRSVYLDNLSLSISTSCSRSELSSSTDELRIKQETQRPHHSPVQQFLVTFGVICYFYFKL